jgi:hemoglobin-like flavoprotein
MSVKMLDNVQDLVPALQRLAARHVAYGSTLEQYGAVGEALLYALEQVSGTQWNAAVADAWVTVYSLMLSVMIPAQVEADAAKKAKAAAAAATANGASAVANGL